MGGQSVFGEQVVTKLPVMMKARSDFDYSRYDINSKEQDIIELVAEGMSNKEIAAKLFLSEGTVRNYLSEILEKLSLRDRTQLAVFIIQMSKPKPKPELIKAGICYMLSMIRKRYNC